MPVVKIVVEKQAIRYDLTRTKGYIQQFAQQAYGHNPQAQSLHILGLAHRQMPLKGGIEFSTSFAGISPKMCVWYKSVDLKIIHDPLVFIATEVPSGGCLYNQILAHEMQHLIVDGKILEKYVPMLEHEINKTLKTMKPPPPVNMTETESVSKDLTDILNATIKRVIDAMMAENNARQSVVDSPAEYTLRQMKCLGENTESVRR